VVPSDVLLFAERLDCHLAHGNSVDAQHTVTIQRLILTDRVLQIAVMQRDIFSTLLLSVTGGTSVRHAHASHALDHGAPIHLVQATLGHTSVATTSAYLHARPGDSSARFVTVAGFSPELDRFRLPLGPSEVMNVWTANHELQGRNMATFTIDSENNITAHPRPPGRR
jgi:hypothetical protein